MTASSATSHPDAKSPKSMTPSGSTDPLVVLVHTTLSSVMSPWMGCTRNSCLTRSSCSSAEVDADTTRARRASSPTDGASSAITAPAFRRSHCSILSTPGAVNSARCFAVSPASEPRAATAAGGRYLREARISPSR